MKRKKIYRTFIWAASIYFVLFFSSRAYFRATDDFRLANISCDLPFNHNLHQPDLSASQVEEIRKILQQRYTYLGKGAQSYVFASEDDRYVVKFFKFKHLRPNFFDSFFSDGEKTARKQRLWQSIFEGHDLAYTRRKEETGLIHVQLLPTKMFGQTMQVEDKLGLVRTIALDQVVFVLQKKTIPTRTVLTDAMARGDLVQVKQKITALFDLYKSGYKEGIYDRDHGVMHNTGFYGDTPIHFDVGKMADEPKMRQQHVWKEDLAKVAKKFHIWLKYNHPEHYSEIAASIDQNLAG